MIPASLVLGHLKREVLLVEAELVDLTNEVVKELLAHGGLSGEEVHAVVGASEEG